MDSYESEAPADLAVRRHSWEDAPFLSCRLIRKNNLEIPKNIMYII